MKTEQKSEKENMSIFNDEIHIFKKKIEDNPTFYMHHYRLGAALEKVGQIDGAIGAYRRSIELNNKSSFSYDNLGQVLTLKGQLDEAIEMYKKAIELNPFFHVFHYNLAQVLVQKNDVNNAIQQLMVCLHKNPQHYPSYDLIGDCLIERGKDQNLILQIYKQGLLATRHDHLKYQKIIQKIYNLGLDIQKINGDVFFKNLLVSSDFWYQHQPKTQKNEWILIEGQISPQNLTNATESLILAKYLQKLYGYRIAAFVSSKRYELKQVLISFGVEKFIDYQCRNEEISLEQKNQLEKFSSEADDNNFKLLMRDFKCETLHIGDLVYDWLIKQEPLSTPEFDERVINKLKAGCITYNFWKQFLNCCNVKSFISGHCSVYDHGIISRLVVTKGGTVFQGRFSVCQYETVDELYDFHTFIPEKLFLYFWNNFKCKAIETGKELVEKTMKIKQSENSNLYLTKAYASDKKVYTHVELCRKLNLEPSLPIVIVASHVFNDVPHCQRHRLFVDYYEFLVETLKICSQITSVNWIVKEHPHMGETKHKYNVDKTAKKLVNDKFNSYRHISLAPDDMNNISLINFCHAVVTVSGTIAHELACFGIPSVLAGSSSYSDCGFTNNPQSIDDYRLILSNIHNLEKLPRLKIEKAYVAYAILYHYKFFKFKSNFRLDGHPHSAMASFANKIRKGEIGTVEEDLFFKNFIVQILLKQKHLLRFDEILP